MTPDPDLDQKFLEIASRETYKDLKNDIYHLRGTVKVMFEHAKGDKFWTCELMRRAFLDHWNEADHTPEMLMEMLSVAIVELHTRTEPPDD